MSEIKVKQSLANLQKAILRLEETLLESPANALIIDATIQRLLLRLC